MAEIETYHSQKVEDFATLTKEHLDGEIQVYEQVRRIVYCTATDLTTRPDTGKDESRKRKF
jgi:hypothetical protein